MPPGVQGLDRYAYTNNNPIIYSDPSGHWPIIDFFAGMAYQYANDMTFGFLDKIAYSDYGVCLDCNRSSDFKQGQVVGREVTTSVAAYNTVNGAATTAAAVTALTVTGVSGTACTITTGGACAVVAVPATVLEAVVAITGAAQSAHGIALAAQIKNNPLNPDDYDDEQWTGGTKPMSPNPGGGENGTPGSNTAQNTQSKAAWKSVQDELGISIPQDQWHAFVAKQKWGFQQMVDEGINWWSKKK